LTGEARSRGEFLALARHVDLVCAMNLHLLRGLIGELGAGAQARLDPAEGRCCVTITLS
jgi:predicted ArsR family transcriptional regulator